MRGIRQLNKIIMNISIVTLLKDKVAGEQLKTLFMLPRYDHVFSVSSRSRREAFFWGGHFLLYWTLTAGEFKEHSVEERVWITCSKGTRLESNLACLCRVFSLNTQWACSTTREPHKHNFATLLSC